MNVEYFANDALDSSLVLLYGSDPNDVVTLSEALDDLAQAVARRIAIHELPGFSSIGGCQLFGSVARSNVGVKMVVPPAVFDCSLRPETWADIVGLLEPFSRSRETAETQFQYLDESGDIRLLISTERAW